MSLAILCCAAVLALPAWAGDAPTLPAPEVARQVAADTMPSSPGTAPAGTPGAGPERTAARRYGAPQAPQVALTAARVAEPQTWVVERDDGERPWRIFLSVPPGEPPAAGWPVLYLLDGNAVFQALTPAEPGDQPAPVVLVGVGYDTERRLEGDTRAWDYLPTPSGQAEPDPRAAQRRNGGADAFLAVLRDTIQPEVARRVPVDAQRQTLMGHSYGGVFALHALLSGTPAFQRFVVVSPSLWWRAPWLQTRTQDFLATRPAPRPVLFMVGGQEGGGRAPAGTPGVRDVATWFTELWPATRLRVFEDLGHGPMLPAAIDPAIDFALAR